MIPRPPPLLLLLLLVTLLFGPACMRATAEPQFVALACVELDPACPARPSGFGLAVTSSPPPTGSDLVAMLRSPAPAGNFALQRRPSPAAPVWLVAAGPLQSSDRAPRLHRVEVQGQAVVVEFEYTPFASQGADRRRFVPSYPVALLPMLSLPTGRVVITARWMPATDQTGPTGFDAFVLDPLALEVP